jgi:hypothetical protein
MARRSAGKELDQSRRHLVFKTQSETRISEQAELHSHAELIAGATLRQNKIPVVVTDGIKPDQGGIVVRHSEKAVAVGVVQQAPSRHRALRLFVRQSILSRSIAVLSGNHA